MSFWNKYSQYVSVAEKKAKAEAKLKQLKKKSPGIKPVVLEGSALARSWWGKSWNRNLERYADYENRIGRGRSYLRQGAVLDLQISAGTVTALVQGSRSKPYEVKIVIKALGGPQWTAIKKSCIGRLHSLPDLLAGRLPKELNEIFLGEGTGLFPSPKEISFACSCPDWAAMCKHVAATLYGIGARLDEDPSLFFTLRAVRMEELVAETIQDKTAELLKKATKKSTKAMEVDDLSALFGIELDTPPHFAGAEKEDAGEENPPTGATLPAIGLPKKIKLSRRKPLVAPPIDQVAALIAKSKRGIDAETLAQKTGLSKIKIYGLVQRLKVQGKIKNKERGVYILA